MPRIELPPTKSSLRKLKEDLAFAYEGYDLLNQKRELLALEIVRHIGEIRIIEAEFVDALAKLYDAYRRTALDMGSDAMTLKSCSEKRGYFLHLELTRLMGLKLPNISLSFKRPRAGATMPGTTAGYDTARDRSRKALSVLARYAALTKTIIMLSRELKKVQRRVNALEKIYIPQHEEARSYISDRIEEMEREEVYVKKLIRLKKEG